MSTIGINDKNFLKQQALRALRGVGDSDAGEWQEWRNNTYHVKRRLTEEEQESVGCPVDIRGTQEAIERRAVVEQWIPAHMKNWIE